MVVAMSFEREMFKPKPIGETTKQLGVPPEAPSEVIQNSDYDIDLLRYFTCMLIVGIRAECKKGV